MVEIEIGQALRVIDKILEPDRLNAVQELVLRECWHGKTYQEIASGSGYDSDYIRVVGSRLWQNLSQVFEEKITKNNFKAVLIQQSSKGQFFIGTKEFPNGVVPLNSRYYTPRPPYENLTYEEILSPGALIRVKSPLNMGKTSLMTRVLAQARSHNYSTVMLNLQLAEASVLSDLEKFLRWLMANITMQLGIKSEIDEYWDEDLGTKISCTAYFQGYILEQLSEPLVLVLDEVNHLFEYPVIAQEFLPLIRFWHEEANNFEIWQNLRLVVIHSTDIYIPLDINQSPFNLGLPIVLPEFNLEQVKQLASRHQFQLEIADLDQGLQSLMDLIGGNPYLVRLAFYALSTQAITLEQLLADAPTSSGIYCNHLRGYLATLQKYPELAAAFKQVVNADASIQVPTIPAYKLESIGLVKSIKNEVVISRQLYLIYFRNHLEF